MPGHKTYAKTPSQATILTLPLSEEGILHYPQFVLKEDEFAFHQRLREDVCNLLICRYILLLHCPLLHAVTDEAVLDFYVFQFVMKHRIVRELNATLVVTVNQGNFQLLIKQPHE
jgi:hypothetical protein